MNIFDEIKVRISSLFLVLGIAAFGLLKSLEDLSVQINNLMIYGGIVSVITVTALLRFIEWRHDKRMTKSVAANKSRGEQLDFTLLETASCMWSYNPVSNKMTWSYHAYSILDYKIYEVTPSVDAILEKVDVNNRASVKAEYQDALEGDRESLSFEFDILLQDGAIRRIKNISKRYYSKSFKAYIYIGLMINISNEQKIQALLIEHMQKEKETALASIVVLANFFERRDAYTAGHQKRVSELAAAIAKELHLDEHVIDEIRVGGMIHDIGKIAIPDDILVKPTTLSDIEYELVKTHAQEGYEIIKNVKSPWNIADIVLHHHERNDGSGYPSGLMGDKVTLPVKIIAIADVVEAMSGHRPYRPALGIDAALNEIEMNKGKLYDEKAVDACVKLFKENRFAFPES